MQRIEGFETGGDFWNAVVVPDLMDSQEKPDDLRLAYHCAFSLFHLHDWVFCTYRDPVCSSFKFVQQDKKSKTVESARQFASALEQEYPNFALIRGIANAGKHLSLNGPRPHPDITITNAAQIGTRALGWGEGGFGVGPYGGSPQVITEAESGPRQFSSISRSVYEMWQRLNAMQRWWPVSANACDDIAR
jgi:hypothetical protein